MNQTTRLAPAPFRTAPQEALIGNTPLLDLSQFAPEGTKVLAKAEWHNPGGSIKDRAAHRIVTDAIQRGDLRPGVTLLDATSGNTGIAYAWLGAAKGFPVRLCISEGVSRERLAILRALGAQFEFTDPAETTDGAIRRARELAAEDPGRFYYADQYNNPSNPAAHEHTTGPEIWQQTGGNVTHFVAGLGTTGTLIGTGRYLRPKGVQLVGIQPDQAFHGLEGLKHLDTAITPGIFDPTGVDQQLAVATEDAHAAVRRLAREAGLMVGISSGAAFIAALRVAESNPGATIVTVFADSGDKYLTNPFWSQP